MTYITDQRFENIDYTESPLPKSEYEACTFTNCNLSQTDIGNTAFIDCSFKGCNLSNIKTTDTAFRDVLFNNCKMLGIHFQTCNSFLFSATFKKCMLNFSSFFQLKLKNIFFDDCIIHEADFSEADLTNVSFSLCDLKGAVFDGTNLEKADFSTAYNYTIDPEKNKIKKAKFSIDGLPGLLNKYNIIVK